MWASSKPWFWKLRTWLTAIGFAFERNAYKSSVLATTTKASAHIVGTLIWIGVKGLFAIVLVLVTLNLIEDYARNNSSWLQLFGEDDKKSNIEQQHTHRISAT